MTNERFTIKPQDDYFGIIDNNTADKMNVINGIRTEIETKWLCDLLNELHEENEQLKHTIKTYKKGNKLLKTTLDEIKKENNELKQFKKTTTKIIKKYNEIYS